APPYMLDGGPERLDVLAEVDFIRRQHECVQLAVGNDGPPVRALGECEERVLVRQQIVVGRRSDDLLVAVTRSERRCVPVFGDGDRMHAPTTERPHARDAAPRIVDREEDGLTLVWIRSHTGMMTRQHLTMQT